MTRRTGVVLALALAAGALALAVGATHAATARIATTPGFVGCRGFVVHRPKLIVRPRSIIVTCADANFYFGRLTWSSWTASSAAGTGTAHENDCDPYCAAGHFHAYPATVRLDAPKTCNGRRELTRLSWRFTGAVPKGNKRTDSQTFRCA